MAAKAVVLLSGGLDSVTCLAVAKKEKFEIHALCFDYGQRHRIEIECARRSAAAITGGSSSSTRPGTVPVSTAPRRFPPPARPARNSAAPCAGSV